MREVVIYPIQVNRPRYTAHSEIDNYIYHGADIQDSLDSDETQGKQTHGQRAYCSSIDAETEWITPVPSRLIRLVTLVSPSHTSERRQLKGATLR
jgi:hypothetical protein